MYVDSIFRWDLKYSHKKECFRILKVKFQIRSEGINKCSSCWEQKVENKASYRWWVESVPISIEDEFGLGG